MAKEPIDMSNVANFADYRSAAPQAANDATPSSVQAPQTLLRRTGQVSLMLLLGLARGLLATLRVLAFVILTTLRWPIRVALGLVTFFMLLGLPMFWFGFPEGSHERSLYCTVAILAGFGSALLRYFYDELLLKLTPRQTEA